MITNLKVTCVSVVHTTEGSIVRFDYGPQDDRQRHEFPLSFNEAQGYVPGRTYFINISVNPVNVTDIPQAWPTFDHAIQDMPLINEDGTLKQATGTPPVKNDFDAYCGVPVKDNDLTKPMDF